MVVYDDTGREDPLTRAMAPPPNETCVPLSISSDLWPASDLAFSFTLTLITALVSSLHDLYDSPAACPLPYSDLRLRT